MISSLLKPHKVLVYTIVTKMVTMFNTLVKYSSRKISAYILSKSFLNPTVTFGVLRGKIFKYSSPSVWQVVYCKAKPLRRNV